MENILISACEMAVVYAWLAHDESSAGADGWRQEESRKRVSSSRYSRAGFGIASGINTKVNYLKEGGK